jgi:microcompartment protein CcmL/EutN
MEKTAFEVGFEKAATLASGMVNLIKSDVGKVTPKFTGELAAAGKATAKGAVEAAKQTGKNVASAAAKGVDESTHKALTDMYSKSQAKSTQFKSFWS